MIDIAVFAFEIGVLEEQFSYALQGASGTTRFDRYYAYCCEHLTTDQFILAAHTIFAEDDRFPKPKRFVEAAQATLDEQAISEWVRLTVAAQHITRTQTEGLSQEQLCPGLTAHARFALESIGGLHVIADADTVNQLGFTRRDFLAAYKAFNNPTTQSAHADRLLTGRTENLLPPATDTPLQALTPTLGEMPFEHREAIQQANKAVREKYPVQPLHPRLEDPAGEAPDEDYFQDFGLFQGFTRAYKAAVDVSAEEADLALRDVQALAATAHPAIVRMVIAWLDSLAATPKTATKKHGDFPVDLASIGKRL